MARLRITRELNRRLNRSGKRRCDVCQNLSILVEHHIRGRKIARPHHSSNLANVCPNCHMDIHAGKVIIEKWIMSTEGKFLMWHQAGETSLTGDDSNPHQIGKQHERKAQ